MRGQWNAQRHEDLCSSGIPDLSYAISGTDGWIELKSLDLPRDFVKPGLSKGQMIWLTQRGRTGNGNCFILLRVGKEHLLFSWRNAEILTERQSIVKLRDKAIRRWASGVDFNDLARFLADPTE